MARGINKVILIGNLGRDPETRYTQSGSAVTNLRIATSDSWRDRETNEQHERTEWHTVVCFARLGEIAGEYLRKGSKVYIEGRLQTSSWEAQDGQTRYRTEVIARDLQMLDPRGAGGGQAGGGQQEGPPPEAYDAPPSSQGKPRAGAQPRPAAEDADDFDDDIPF